MKKLEQKKYFPADSSINKRKLLLKLESSIVQAVDINYLLFDSIRFLSDVKISEYDYKVWWIFDCIAEKIVRTHDHIKKPFFDDVEQLIKYAKYEKTNYNLCVDLSSSEIRKTLGKPQLKGKKIHGLVHEAAGIVIDGKSKLFFDKNKNRHVSFGKMDSLFEVYYLEDDELSDVKEKLHPDAKYYYRFVFDNRVFGVCFFHNILMGKYFCVPKLVSKMKPYSQKIFRVVCVLRGNRAENMIELKMSALIRLADSKDKKERQIRSEIKRALEELKQKKLIKDFKIIKEKKDYLVKITKNKKGVQL